ncbi:hypothetical protein [Ornithinibacillus halophilus]|uniref:Uncharacterized protein n=1 Tax=Ornithinibacillus halophilus TaxID=930117 RepID=A0A1M5HLC1_9BACI|nr:hypothetical protein [Ornithinibacillus halophilus]SHG16642.1 hypothetical protein SAMN05216225_101828 [Ornithinibacillus halophilus]
MKSRKETHKKNHFSTKLKVLITSILFIITVLSSFGMAFANEDIQSLLTNWFTDQREVAIESIESAIMTEKDQQKVALQSYIKEAIQSSEKEIKQFTEEEKKRRVQEIKSHAQTLMNNFEVNNKEEKSQIQSEFDAILKRAMEDLNEVEVETAPETNEDKDNVEETNEEEITKGDDDE